MGGMKRRAKELFFCDWAECLWGSPSGEWARGSNWLEFGWVKGAAAPRQPAQRKDKLLPSNSLHSSLISSLSLLSLFAGGLWAQHAPIAPQTKDEHSPQPPFISFRKQSFIQEEENKSNQWIEWNERNCLNLWAAPLNGRVCGLWAGGHLRQPTSFNWFHQSISLRVFCFTIH